MYGKIIRDNSYKANLLDFICKEYNIRATALCEAKRGFYGETWKLESHERQYFAKLDYSEKHKYIYRDSIDVVEYLRKHNIDYISKVVRTVNGMSYTEYRSAVMGVFEWIDGENIQDDQTTIKEFYMLSCIYKIPANDIKLNSETFETSCIDSYKKLFARLEDLQIENNVKRLLHILQVNLARIKHNSSRLTYFANKCKNDVEHFFITHGDAGGNIIKNGDRYSIVDWDEPKLAPPERDAWFCLPWRWAMDSFNAALKQNGHEYSLKSERLAYYAYFSFFHYLNEYLDAFLALPDMREPLLTDIAQFFNGWIIENLKCADMIDSN